MVPPQAHRRSRPRYRRGTMVRPALSVTCMSLRRADQNLSSAPGFEEVKFARDSPLEGGGFEPSVPRGRNYDSPDCPV
jgi:hypothetical protein